ncbi:DUF5018 domain-containing protein [Parachryseolinea silvisoli]|uniref:DUF5018 domain-containing protein n=1 Tax=Parachryseolinea silvisoli TaxID=2873601 RepID=UPI002265D5C2|nr:DUF5018 domain-containing protein [Parachryseolinea silvisoli]MCD9020037.1 DUF5018 domain-containing protein [Parachryseolinea silvisoli]
MRFPLHETFYSAWLTMALLLAAACDTEYENAPYPYKELLTFSFTANGTAVEAAIAEGEILLYWPHAIALPTTITPQLSVSEKAIITPASGTPIPLQDDIIYTVTAEDGSTATYTVKVVVNQPPLSLDDDNPVVVSFGQPADIRGTNILLDASRTTISLIAANGEETQMEIDTIVDGLGTGFGSNILIQLPEDGTTALDTGWYKIKVVSGVRTATTSNAVLSIRYRYPAFEFITHAITVHPGETFSLTGKYLRQLGDARVLVQDGSEEYHSLAKVSSTPTEVIYRVPDDMPAREYYTILPGIVDIFSGTVDYSYQLNVYPNVHPQLIVTEQQEN